MRLLSTDCRHIKQFISDNEIEPYAILSHTWGEEEVTYEDWVNLSRWRVRRKKGFRKIEYCCKQAAKDGLKWVWVDTCCIDKKSSAELTESLNSMFRWYEEAAVCYAYLADVPNDLKNLNANLAKSRWFTRGWTLQELLAPSEVVFYSDDWHQIGTKPKLSASLSKITGIQETYLKGADIQLASVSQRMSWAARRQTSRVEDIAYCLLGIFDVNMSLIYGEGLKAFQRLQEEIMRAYPEDHTLFAWGTVVSAFSRLVKNNAQLLGHEPLDNKAADDDETWFGLLARSPKDFANSGQFICYRDAKNFFRRWDSPLAAPSVVGHTVRLDLPTYDIGNPFAVSYLDRKLRGIAYLRQMKSAVLLCGRQNGPLFTFVTIPLLYCTGGYYTRTSEIVVNDTISFPRVDHNKLWKWRMPTVVERQPQYKPRAGDIIFRRFVSFMPYKMPYSVNDMNAAIPDGFIKALAPTRGRLVCLMFEYTIKVGFGLSISRVGDSKDGLGYMHFGIMPVDLMRPTLPYQTMDGAINYLWDHWQESRYTQEMQLPSDTWKIEETGEIPAVCIKSERMYIDDNPSQPVDIVDIVISRTRPEWEGKFPEPYRRV
ncbi:HET-domain-containing protein [Hypoxylon sp. FL1857]|nr:HET-domain-containing protein [Hypoxylon sp. FL1857]